MPKIVSGLAAAAFLVQLPGSAQASTPGTACPVGSSGFVLAAHRFFFFFFFFFFFSAPSPSTSSPTTTGTPSRSTTSSTTSSDAKGRKRDATRSATE